MTLDENALSSLHMALEADFADVVVLYLQKAPELLVKIKCSYLAADYLTAANATHTLKGSSSNLGLVSLVDLCWQLDDVLRQEVPASVQSIDRLYSQVVEEYQQARSLLDNYCQRQGVVL